MHAWVVKKVVEFFHVIIEQFIIIALPPPPPPSPNYRDFPAVLRIHIILIGIRIRLLTLIRIGIRIRLLTLIRIRIRIRILASNWRLKLLKKCSNRLISFGLSSANWCGSWSSLSLWCGSGSWFLFDADPGSQNDAYPELDPDTDPQHFFPVILSWTKCLDTLVSYFNHKTFLVRAGNVAHPYTIHAGAVGAEARAVYKLRGGPFCLSHDPLIIRSRLVSPRHVSILSRSSCHDSS